MGAAMTTEYQQSASDSLSADAIASFRLFEQLTGSKPRWGFLDDNNEVVRCWMSDLLARCKSNDPLCIRRVSRDYVRGQYLVSTVFLGLDHGYGTRPRWFETMVFRNWRELHATRYETYLSALDGHELIVHELTARVGWARWLGYSQGHLRKIERERKERA